MSVSVGDLWYNDTLGYHVLVTEKEEYPSQWWIVYVLEISQYNWYVQDDFNDYGWVKVA